MVNKTNTVIETLEFNLRAINNCIRLKKGELKEKISRIHYDCPSEYESISILSNSIVCLLKQQEIFEFSLNLLKNNGLCELEDDRFKELINEDEVKQLLNGVITRNE